MKDKTLLITCGTGSFGNHETTNLGHPDSVQQKNLLIQSQKRFTKNQKMGIQWRPIHKKGKLVPSVK